jgi:hypothetical protein
MLSAFTISDRAFRWTRLGLLLGFLLAVLFIAVILIRYAGNAQTSLRYAGLGIGVIAIELAMGAWVLFWGTRPRTDRGSMALRQGTIIGLLCGLLWVIEIGFNNFVSPDISTTTARFYVDNSFWAAIVLIIFVATVISSYRSRQILAGIQVGA